MKKTIILTLSVMMTTSVWADGNNNNNNNNNGGYQRQLKSRAESCDMSALKTAREAATTQGQKLPLDPCEQLYIISMMNGDEPGFAEPDVKPTMDGKVTCLKNGGYTVDFNDCKRVKGLYDSVILAEKAMFAQQTIKVNEANIQQNKEISAAVAQGDTQYAAVEAVQKRNELNHKLNQTQATLYQTAVGLFGAGVTAWQGGNTLKRYCQRKVEAISGEVAERLAYTEFNQNDCMKIAESHKKADIVFNNKDARAQFMMEAGLLVQKAAEAMRRAKEAAYVATRLSETPGFTDDPAVALNFCFNNPEHPECKQNNGHNINSGTFNGNTVDFGAGSGANQGFDFGAGGTADIGDDPLGPGSDTEKVADITSPFEDKAKEASGILDPAGAASVTPGSQNSPPGGAGGGGGGGGGSASLGDDLAGATAKDSGDPDIKTNKVAGKYKAGGGGFQAIGKSGGTDANPFASLFDSKGEAGGIEEDRSIASDMGGEGSGLFQKISKKYGQIHKDKRIESQNLE